MGKQIYIQIAVLASLPLLIMSCSGSKRDNTDDSNIQGSQLEVKDDSYTFDENLILDSVSSHVSTNATTRQKAFDQAFKNGREFGRIDGAKGVNQCSAYASVYSDDWIKQAFIQGYELGLSESGYDDSESYSDDYYDDSDSYYYEADYDDYNDY